jgi:hypothetical protein
MTVVIPITISHIIANLSISIIILFTLLFLFYLKIFPPPIFKKQEFCSVEDAYPALTDFQQARQTDKGGRLGAEATEDPAKCGG